MQGPAPATSPAPIARPYRALLVGIMTLGLAFGVVTGAGALIGGRHIRANGQVQVGSMGFVTGVMAGVALGVFCSVVAVAGLWIGQRLERRARS